MLMNSRGCCDGEGEGFLHLTVEPVTDPGFRYAQILGIMLMLGCSISPSFRIKFVFFVKHNYKYEKLKTLIKTLVIILSEMLLIINSPED